MSSGIVFHLSATSLVRSDICMLGISSSFITFFASAQKNANDVAGFFGRTGAPGKCCAFRFDATSAVATFGTIRGGGGTSPLS